jgi:hypothetical protein
LPKIRPNFAALRHPDFRFYQGISDTREFAPQPRPKFARDAPPASPQQLKDTSHQLTNSVK